MLSSGLREASESKIRLVSKYPQSLRKLLFSFYERELVIESAEELVEMLYLADEYDVPHVMEELVRMISSRSTEPTGDSAASKTDNSPPSMEFTIENAPLFLSCSAKLNLKLEPLIFAGLAQQWWLFGSRGKARDYEKVHCNCLLLLQSLNFTETK
jgi:hypothetical protein